MPIFQTDHPTFMRGPDKGVYLGFSGEAIKRLLKNGGLYFLSWSQNFRDYENFVANPVNFFNHDRMGLDPDWKPELIQVQISGPWAADAILSYIPYSPFDTVESAQAHLDRYASFHSEVVPKYPMYMWMATRC